METADFIKEQLESLLSDYTIENGIITSPGKFEGERYYIIYFYTDWSEGGGDDEYTDEYGNYVTTYKLTHSEKKAFPELKYCNTFEFWETDDGFIEGYAK